MDNIQLDLNNLTDDERKQLMALVEKGNKVSKVWKPKYGDKYWHTGANGDVGCDVWTNYCFDNGCYEMGNCYLTEEDAEFALQKQIVTTELQRFAEEHNDVIDWDNPEQDKKYICYDLHYKALKIRNLWSMRCNDIYFTSDEIAQQAIDTIGADRIKKYYFGVE